MKFDWKKLYSVLDKDRESSWRTMAKEIDVTPSVFTRISQGRPVSVVNLAKLLSMVDDFSYSLKPFLKP